MGSPSGDSVAEQPHLDQSFVSLEPRNYRKYFKKGKVFRALWPEPANSTEEHRKAAVNIARWGEQIILKIHWFVVVQTWSGHCLVVPVHTYDGRGATKSGINADDHCALVPKGQTQITLDGERLRRPPLHLIQENPNVELKPSSRINFAKFHTVEYNIKISTVGRIAPEDVPTMGIYWRQSITKARVDTVPSNHDEWKLLEYQEAERQRQRLGEWLLTSSEYKEWLKPSGRTLFCPGTPGAGKTMLTERVMTDLQNRFSKNRNVGVCYLSCHSGCRRSLSIQDVLNPLAEQLAQKQRMFSKFPTNVGDLYAQHQPERKDMVDKFRALTTELSQTFVVIDALDELEVSNNHETKLLKEILDLQVDLQFKLFATSRFIPRITRLFRNDLIKELRAEHDISVYLDSQMARLPECVRDSPKLQRRIKFHIEQTADGIFLLADRLLEEWTEKSSVVDIETALISQEASFSVLHAAWNDPIQRIVDPRDLKSLAASALMWIICAQWPLTASELQHALAIQLHGDDQNFLGPEKIPSLEEILSACAGFVSIESGTGIVNIVHASAKEFMLQSQWFPNGNEIIAETCAKYLLLEHFATGQVQSDGELQERFESFPLYAYACWNWGHHAQLPSKTSDWKRVVQRFAESPAHVQAWHQAIFCYPAGSTRAGEVRRVHWNVNVLQIAAFLNLESLIDLLIKQHQTNIEVRDEKSRTALSYAAEGGSKRAVKTLIALGAEVEAKDQDGGTPLLWALHHRQDAVVRFLLKRGARLEALDVMDKQLELMLASRSGLLRSVEWLLAKGTAPDIHDGDHHRTPLMWAVMNGHTAIVQELLDEDVDCELKDPFGQTALLLASRMGFESIVRLLIEVDADCNTEDEHGQKPLWWAAKQGHDGIVKLLIDEGVDVEAKDSVEHRSALSLAAEGGYINIIRLLLSQDADQESSSVARQTPLFFAAAAGHVDIVKLLLERGVNPCPLDIFDKTPQDRAILRKDKIIQSQLEIAEESVDRLRDFQFRCSTDGTSRPLDSLPNAARPKFCWEDDEPIHDMDSISTWLEGDSSSSFQLENSLRDSLLQMRGVKQRIVRFMFDYDDNEHRNAPCTIWYTHNTASTHQDMSSCASGQRSTALSQVRKQLRNFADRCASMVVTKASTDENEIFGLKPTTSRRSHSTTRDMDMNLFQRVNDLLVDAVQADPPGHPRRIRLLSDIGMIHVSRYQETQSLDILKRAISSTRQALKELRQSETDLQRRDAAYPAQYSDIQVVLLANLGIQLEHLYRVTAHFSILEEAIRYIRLAISATSSQIERYRLLHILGLQLRDRYAKMGDRMDLDEAIRLTQEAVDSSPPGEQWDLSRIAMLSNLASLLSDRFAESGHITDREKALDIMDEALTLIPEEEMNNTARAAVLNNLGSLHADIFTRTREITDINKAVGHARKALDMVPDMSTERAMIQSHYAMLRCIRHEWLSGEYGHLKDIIDTAQKAAEVARALSGDLIPTAVLYNLGSLHLYRFLKFHGSYDLNEAVSMMKQAISSTLKVHTDLRMVFNHAKIRFGSRHPRMGVLDNTIAVMTRPQWYLQVSGPGEFANGIVGHSDSNSNRNVLKNSLQDNPFEQVDVIAARRMKNGEEKSEQLLDGRGFATVSEKSVEVAAGNTENGETVLQNIFDAYGTTTPITEKVVQAAAGNLTRGDKVMDVLIKRGSHTIVASDTVIRAAVKNEITGGRILVALISQCTRGLKRKRESIDEQLD